MAPGMAGDFFICFHCNGKELCGLAPSFLPFRFMLSGQLRHNPPYGHLRDRRQKWSVKKNFGFDTYEIEKF